MEYTPLQAGQVLVLGNIIYRQGVLCRVRNRLYTIKSKEKSHFLYFTIEGKVLIRVYMRYLWRWLFFSAKVWGSNWGWGSREFIRYLDVTWSNINWYKYKGNNEVYDSVCWSSTKIAASISLQLYWTVFFFCDMIIAYTDSSKMWGQRGKKPCVFSTIFHMKYSFTAWNKNKWTLRVTTCFNLHCRVPRELPFDSSLVFHKQQHTCLDYLRCHDV